MEQVIVLHELELTIVDFSSSEEKKKIALVIDKSKNELTTRVSLSGNDTRFRLRKHALTNGDRGKIESR